MRDSLRACEQREEEEEEKCRATAAAAAASAPGGAAENLGRIHMTILTNTLLEDNLYDDDSFT